VFCVVNIILCGIRHEKNVAICYHKKRSNIIRSIRSLFYVVDVSQKKSGSYMCKKSAKTDQAKNPQDIGSSLAAKKALKHPNVFQTLHVSYSSSG
jgi:hypothetical protein